MAKNISEIENILERISTNDDYNNPSSLSESLKKVDLEANYLVESSLKL